MPIPMRIIPPKTPIFLKKSPNFLPIYTPKNEREKVMIPMIIAGVTMETSKNDRLKPTAKASMLVAMDNIIKTEKLELKSGEFALGVTKEKISLAEDICGWLSGRSRFARLGLLVHITASFVQPGINNEQVLEMRNVSPNDLVVKSGTRVCQLVIERTEGKARYKGRFSKQGL